MNNASLPYLKSMVLTMETSGTTYSVTAIYNKTHQIRHYDLKMFENLGYFS